MSRSVYTTKPGDAWVPADPLGEALHLLRMGIVFYTRSADRFGRVYFVSMKRNKKRYSHSGSRILGSMSM